MDRNLHNSTTLQPRVYAVGSHYLLVQDELRPGNYIVRASLNGVYKGSIEATIKGKIKDVNVIIPNNLFVGTIV